MRIIFKILAAPFVVILTLLVPFLWFVFCFAVGVLYVVNISPPVSRHSGGD